MTDSRQEKARKREVRELTEAKNRWEKRKRKAETALRVASQEARVAVNKADMKLGAINRKLEERQQ